MARTRMSRRELIEKDEITTTLEKVTEFVYARKRELLAVVFVVVVLGGAAVGWRLYAANRNANAQNQLSSAILAFDDTTTYKADKERYDRALALARNVYDAYRSLPAGQIAQYYMALSYEGLGDTKKAVENLENLVQRGNESIKGVATFALAKIHRSHGETEKAISLYEQLLSAGGYSKAAVLFELARFYEDLGQPAKARERYQQIVTEFPESPFRQDADRGLIQLGAAKP